MLESLKTARSVRRSIHSSTAGGGNIPRALAGENVGTAYLVKR